MFDDPQINSQQLVTNDQPQASPTDSANAPATNASPSRPPVVSASGPASGVQPTAADAQQTLPQSPNRTVKSAQGDRIVSNMPQQPQTDNSQHPLVAKAGLLHDVAHVLAGSPKTVTIDDQGNRIVKPAPVSGKSLMIAIALEALTGSMAGLAGGRGRGPGAAGTTALQQSILRRQQAQAQQDEQAQQQFNDRAKAIAGKAAIAEVNSRTLLNTSESEKFGTDAIDKAVEINRASGVLDVDPTLLENGGEPMTQAEMLDAMKAGKISSTDQIGPVAGRVQITNKDGTTRWEATHLIIKDPSSKVALSQETWDRFASAGVPGFPAGVHIGSGTEIKLSTMQRANEVMAAHSLSDFRLREMRDVLAGTSYADRVPASVDFSKPGVESAMQRFQKYVSHSAQHGMDVYESLQAMGADKRDPKTGAMQPNADARYVDQIAQAMGGWSVLEAVHNQLLANKKTAEQFSIIDSEAKATAVLASPNKFTRDQLSSARNFLTLADQQGARKAADDARQRAIAEGKDVEAMYKFGTNPITKEKLTLENSPDSMLVDAKGRPVPQDMQSFYKPSQNEKQTADTAKQALAISADLRAAIQKNPNLVGPLAGNSKKGLAALGLGDAEAQKMLDDVSFLQSAATKVHTGRFSSEILHKMSKMIQPGMNPQQFVGGLNSIDEVMGRYAQEDRLITVADYRAMQQAGTNLSKSPQTQAPPAGATGKVRASDGTMHWTDGHKDLGVAQ